ncbi:carbonic anhydrase [Desarmillaria ectypa]|nr:carbonic anhydrase [Desarmillaria ectypa]
MSEHAIIARLFASNAQWAADVDQAEPEFFTELAQGQSPPVCFQRRPQNMLLILSLSQILWIGCADSRVPESVITGSRPGTIFVLRNIANQFHLDDDSALSALAYAVDHLGVEHVVVVGHSECGGASACFSAAPSYTSGEPCATVAGLSPEEAINKWLYPVTALAASLHLSSAPKEEALPILIEENVRMQVDNLSQASTIINAWKNKSGKGKDVYIHGWVFDLASGRLKDLRVSRGPPSK